MQVSPNLVKAVNVSGLAFSGFLMAQMVSPATAATYVMPPMGEAVVGMMQETWIQNSETLYDIARKYSLGINELAHANPDVDVWLPHERQRVVVPTQFILPDAPYEGIIVNLPEMRLYYFPPAVKGHFSKVITYPIGIGAEGNAIPLAVTKIIEKKKDPHWIVPDSIIAEHAAEGEILPKVVPPGPDNPLGKFALRLGLNTFLIHSTNRPPSVGMRTSHGCLRMYPENIERLYPLVPLDTPVRIINQPYKAGWRDGILYLEAHEHLVEGADSAEKDESNLKAVLTRQHQQWQEKLGWDQVSLTARQFSGVPMALFKRPEHKPDTPSGNAKTKSNKMVWMARLGSFKEIAQAAHTGMLVGNLGLPVKLVAGNSPASCDTLVGPFPSRNEANAALLKVLRHVDLEGIKTTIGKYTDREPCGAEQQHGPSTLDGKEQG